MSRYLDLPRNFHCVLRRLCHHRVRKQMALLVLGAAVLCGAGTAGAPVPAPQSLNGPSMPPDIADKGKGTRLFPYDWLLALEQTDSADKFLSESTIRRYGFLTDADKELPLGFVEYDPGGKLEGEFLCENSSGERIQGLRQVGLNCAACHTGELHFTHSQGGRKHVLRVHGGPSMQDNLAFMRALYEALRRTLQDPVKMKSFAQMLEAKPGLKAKPGHEGLTPEGIARCVEHFLKQKDEHSYNAEYPGYSTLYPLEWGYGRFDALGRGGNTLFEKLDHDNIRPADGPVSIPAVWSHVFNYNRFQWNGAIRNYRARYIGQVLGMNAFIRLDGEESDRFEIGFKYQDLEDIARWYEDVPPPAWPSEIFDDRQRPAPSDLKKHGKKLYAQFCAGCHVPENGRVQKQEDVKQESCKDIKKEECRSATKAEPYRLKMIPLDEIGTDPVAARNFYYRTVTAPTLLSPPDPEFGAKMSAARAGEYLTTEILKRNKKHEDAHQNRWQAQLAYVARPHAGVWATPPFLHNGSIPNIYLLLSPQEERDAQARTFCLGDLEFDPERIGFVLKGPACRKTEFLFDTTLRGNRNTGHEFRKDDRHGRTFEEPKDCERLAKHSRDGILGCELDPSARQAIVEYLKTCDFDLPWDDDPEVIKPCPYPPPNPSAYR